MYCIVTQYLHTLWNDYHDKSNNHLSQHKVITILLTIFIKLYTASLWYLLYIGGLPAMRETQVQSLGQEVPLEKETATQSSILDWRIPWTQQPGRGFFFFFWRPWGLKESDWSCCKGVAIPQESDFFKKFIDVYNFRQKLGVLWVNFHVDVLNPLETLIDMYHLWICSYN